MAVGAFRGDISLPIPSRLTKLSPLVGAPTHDGAALLQQLETLIESSPLCIDESARRAVLFDCIYGPRVHRHDFDGSSVALRTCERMATQATVHKLRLKHLLTANGEMIPDGGKLRTHSSCIGGVGGQFATRVPPAHAEVPRLMEDLLGFIARQSSADLLTATVAMERFLQIHPFRDGNGRTARLLFLALLVSAYGWRLIFADMLGCLFRSGNHELLLASLHQQQTGDWTEVLRLYRRLIDS